MHLLALLGVGSLAGLSPRGSLADNQTSTTGDGATQLQRGGFITVVIVLTCLRCRIFTDLKIAFLMGNNKS